MTQLDISPTWNSLTKPQQRRGWDRFTQALDRGNAGYHRFYRVLMPSGKAASGPEAGVSNPPLCVARPGAEGPPPMLQDGVE